MNEIDKRFKGYLNWERAAMDCVRFKGVRHQPYTYQLNHVANSKPLLSLQLFTEKWLNNSYNYW